MDSQAIHEKKRKDSEIFVLMKEWIDPLLDMTMDSPQRVTRKMLKLRMCIEQALKRMSSRRKTRRYCGKLLRR
jgi:hypothetical protein